MPHHVLVEGRVGHSTRRLSVACVARHRGAQGGCGGWTRIRSELGSTLGRGWAGWTPQLAHATHVEVEEGGVVLQTKVTSNLHLAYGYGRIPEIEISRLFIFLLEICGIYFRPGPTTFHVDSPLQRPVAHCSAPLPRVTLPLKYTGVRLFLFIFFFTTDICAASAIRARFYLSTHARVCKVGETSSCALASRTSQRCVCVGHCVYLYTIMCSTSWM